jgi:hypothetical protein
MVKNRKTCSFEIIETENKNGLIRFCGRLDIETAMDTFQKLSADVKERSFD